MKYTGAIILGNVICVGNGYQRCWNKGLFQGDLGNRLLVEGAGLYLNDQVGIIWMFGLRRRVFLVIFQRHAGR